MKNNRFLGNRLAKRLKRLKEGYISGVIQPEVALIPLQFEYTIEINGVTRYRRFAGCLR